MHAILLNEISSIHKAESTQYLCSTLDGIAGMNILPS
jgi:hypothetical protein